MYLFNLSGEKPYSRRGITRRPTLSKATSCVYSACGACESPGQPGRARPRVLAGRASMQIRKQSILTGSESWPATTGTEPSCERVRLA